MELVKGIPLTKFCDEQRLSIQERLELFMPVCHAIQHAHQKGVIHRDIKPSNVLVALYDGRPVPKVIDFGIAKATGQRLTDRTLFTEFGAVIGTLEYMSPEQAEMNQIDIDTRSDIYSLGVLLYELLTGTTPLTRETVKQAAFAEVLRRIREEEPPRPSTRLSQTADRLASLSAQRKLEPKQLTNALRGDLDWIVMKALEKERNRRYETANGLARDIQRHLENLPIEAKSPSLLYTARKFVRRRTRSVVAACLGMALLVCAGVVALQQKRAQALRQSAELAGLRNEESEVLSKILGNLPVSKIEKNRAKQCITRLSNRVRTGRGSQADVDLLARLLCVNVALEGHSLQQLREPSVSLWCKSGRINIEGLGAVLTPRAALDDSETEVKVPNWPAYISGEGSGSLSSGWGVGVPLHEQLTNSGYFGVRCLLTVQLVKSKGGSRSDAKISEYEQIGSPVSIALQPFFATLVDEFPENYPAQLSDTRGADQVRSGLVVSGAWFSPHQRSRKERLHLRIELPLHARLFPLALQVDLRRLDERPLNLPVSALRRSVERGIYSAAADGASGVRFAAGNAIFETSLVLPDEMQDQAGRKPLRGVISIRSSREVARKAGFENFLDVREFEKEFQITSTNRTAQVP